MKEQFVNFEIAKQLKELGFDGHCFGFYNDSGMLFYQCIAKQYDGYIDITKVEFEIYKEDIAAPLWQQSIDWFRESHNLMISLRFEIDSWNWHISSDIKFMDIWVHGYKRYEEAREQVILKALEIIKSV